MIDASFMYNISFIWIIWRVTKRPNRSFQWCFYFALGYLNPPSWTELNGICKKKSITQQSLPYPWSPPTVTNHWICPWPLLNAKSRFCCSACALHIFAVFCQKSTTLRTSCFFLRTPTKISLIYNDMQLWKIGLFYQVNPMKNQVVFQLPMICLQARKRICCNWNPTTLSKWSFLETYHGFPKVDSFWERCFFCKRTFAVCICLGFPYLYSLEMGVKGL